MGGFRVGYGHIFAGLAALSLLGTASISRAQEYSIAITNPADGAVLPGCDEISFGCAVSPSPSHVRYALDDQYTFSSARKPPFSSHPTYLRSGTHSVNAIATWVTNGTLIYLTNTIAITVHSCYAASGTPYVVMERDWDGRQASAGYGIYLRARADGFTGMDHVEFHADGVTVLSTTNVRSSYDPLPTYHGVWQAVPEGTHEVCAVAFDLDGNRATSDTITVTAEIPRGTAPIADATLTASYSPTLGSRFTCAEQASELKAGSVIGNWGYSCRTVLEFDISDLVPGPRSLRMSPYSIEPIRGLDRSFRVYMKEGDGIIDLSDGFTQISNQHQVYWYNIRDPAYIPVGIVTPRTGDTAGVYAQFSWDSDPSGIDYAIARGWTNVTFLIEEIDGLGQGTFRFSSLENPYFPPPLLMPEPGFTDAPLIRKVDGTSYAVWEAEEYHSTEPGGGRVTSVMNTPACSAGAALGSESDAADAGGDTPAPSALYWMRLNEPGPYTLWMKLRPGSFGINHCTAELTDSQTNRTHWSMRVLKPVNTYAWIPLYIDAGSGTVLNPGLHALTVEFNNPDVIVDRMLLTTDPDFNPGLNEPPPPAPKDRDGDGQSDIDEYLAGTDMLDAKESFRVNGTPPSSGHPLKLEFTTVPGRDYILEFRSSLTEGAWTPVTDTVDGDGNRKAVAVAEEPEMGFYRVRARLH